MALRILEALKGLVEAGPEVSDEYGSRCYFCGVEVTETPAYAAMQKSNHDLYNEYIAKFKAEAEAAGPYTGLVQHEVQYKALLACRDDERHLPWPDVAHEILHREDCVWVEAKAAADEASGVRGGPEIVEDDDA